MTDLRWLEYKVFKQYQALGDMLEEFKLYGYRAGIKNIVQKNKIFENGNGHRWLNEEPPNPIKTRVFFPETSSKKS